MATFTGLDYGYYVVAVPGATLANASGQYATLVSVDSTNVTANIKGDLPTVDKKVQVGGTGKDATDAKIGDTLTFTLTSTIPDMSAYDTYTFNFKDTLSQGLTFGQVTSVTVEGVTDPLTVNTDYTVTTPTVSDNTLTVAMKDFKAKQQANAGKKITVTYTATLNEKAVVGGVGNTNSATIQYSNNPSSGGTGESEPSKVRVFTYGFTVDKYTGDKYDDDATRLAGAEFTLAPKNGTAMSFVQVDAGSATANAVYRVAKAGETDTTTTITTPASGKVVFRGLENGEYTLTETKAPAGYNKLASAIGVKVDGKNDGTDTTGCHRRHHLQQRQWQQLQPDRIERCHPGPEQVRCYPAWHWWHGYHRLHGDWCAGHRARRCLDSQAQERLTSMAGVLGVKGTHPLRPQHGFLAKRTLDETTAQHPALTGHSRWNAHSVLSDDQQLPHYAQRQPRRK